MKKILKFTAAILALVAGLTASALAADNDLPPIKVLLDGQNIAFDSEPIIDNGRTLVPLRAIFQALGAEVDWDADTRTVTAVKEDTTVIMTIGEGSFYVNDEEIALDTPAKIVKNRTLVPVRAISNSFDVDVDWVAEDRAVILVADEFIKAANREINNVTEMVVEGEFSISDSEIVVDTYCCFGIDAENSLFFMDLNMECMGVSKSSLTAASEDMYITLEDGVISATPSDGSEGSSPEEMFSDMFTALGGSYLYEGEEGDHKIYQFISTETGLPLGCKIYFNKDTFLFEKMLMAGDAFLPEANENTQIDDIMFTITYDSGITAEVWEYLNQAYKEQHGITAV